VNPVHLDALDRLIRDLVESRSPQRAEPGSQTRQTFLSFQADYNRQETL
jgi:hypothetical protein